MKTKSVILLSGGLDSLVSLALSKDAYNVELAITFDYGQKASERELKSSKEIAKFYNIKHEIITLDWLKNISKSTLTTNADIPILNNKELDNKSITEKSAQSVWVPNRNGLFINIAACYADAHDYTNIIIGANKEEGATFKDNSLEFIQAVNTSLKYSVSNNVEVTAPLITMNKTEIVKSGLELNAPFKLVYSCYLNNEKHCGRCESCLRLKRALELNNRYDIIADIF